MGASNPRNSAQDKLSGSCRRIGKMAVLTKCGVCDRSVVGVTVGKGGRYCIECKSCGYSATSHYKDANSPPKV